MGINTLIGSAEAAQLLGMSSTTFNRRVLAGYIPAVQKLPGSKGAWVFDRAEIERLAAEEAKA